MKISVHAKSNAKKPEIKKIAEDTYSIAVSEPPEKGKANMAIRHALAEYFHISPSLIKLIKGHVSKRKIFEMPDETMPKGRNLF